jgi:hypothetical protein
MTDWKPGGEAVDLGEDGAARLQVPGVPEKVAVDVAVVPLPGLDVGGGGQLAGKLAVVLLRPVLVDRVPGARVV